MSFSLELEKLLPPKNEDADVTYNEDDEEEALSLSDLPVSKPNGDQEILQETTQNDEVDDFAFDFGSLIGSIPALESDMCVADEVFYGGQILPFRHSVSSELRLSRIRIPNRVVSIDRTRFGSSSSSRSSSTRSHQSNSSSTSATTTTTSSSSSQAGLPDPKPRNQFYSYPSPKARVKNSSGWRISNSKVYSSSKSTTWQVLRLGLVRTPEIELQGRTNIYINKLNKNSSNKIGDLLCEMPRGNNSLIYDEKNRAKRSGNNNGGFFKSCKFTVGAIEPSPTTRINGNLSCRSSSKLSRSRVLSEDKEEIRQKERRWGKQRLSNHRTFEWPRDLSHPNILNL